MFSTYTYDSKAGGPPQPADSWFSIDDVALFETQKQTSKAKNWYAEQHRVGKFIGKRTRNNETPFFTILDVFGVS